MSLSFSSASRLLLIGVLCLAAAPSLARADNDDGAAAANPAAASEEDVLSQAKTHFQAGKDAFSARDYTGAVAEFRKAQQLKPSPLLDYNIGLCLEALGKPKKAIKAYQAYLDQKPDAENRGEVEARIAGLSRAPAVDGTQTPVAEPGEEEGARRPPVGRSRMNDFGDQQGLELAPQKRSYKTSRRWGLFGAGMAIFGGLYLIDIGAGAVSYAGGGNSYELFIPLVGPLIYAAKYNSDPLNGTCNYDFNGNATDCSSAINGYVTAAMVLDFLGQAAGLTMAIVGVATKRQVPIWANIKPRFDPRFAGVTFSSHF